MTEHEAAAAWWINADPTITAPVSAARTPAAGTGPGVTGSEPGVLARRLPGHLTSEFVSEASAPSGTAAAPVAPTPGAAATP